MTLSISTREPADPFPKIAHDAGSHILSYLGYSDLSRFAAASRGARDLRDKSNFQLERFIFSKIEIFDRKHWKEYWNVEVTDQYDAGKMDIKVMRAFLRAYYGPNPIGPGRACDHCLTPAVVPSQMHRKHSSDSVEEQYCLSVLGEIAEHPLKGYPAKYARLSESLRQHGMTPSGHAKLVVKMTGVIGRCKRWSEQVQILNEMHAKTGWGSLPDALSQNTTILAHHAITGERAHGDATGMEGQMTYGRTIEKLRFIEENMVSGGFVRSTAMDEFNIRHSSFANNINGVGVQREF